MATIAELEARISANTQPLSDGLNKAGRDLEQFGTTTHRQSRRAETAMKRAEMAAKALQAATMIVAGAMAAAGVAIVKMATDGLKAADEQAKLARQLGMTNSELATLERAADFSGVSMGTLTTATRRLDTELGNALSGVDASRERFESLGLSVEELAHLRPDDRLKMIGEAIGTLGTHAEQTAAANDIFGRSGQEMMLLLADAAPVLERASSEVETFGLALQSVDSERIESINDNISTLQQSTRGAALQMADGLSPAILAVTDKLVDMANDSEFMGKVVDAAVQWVIKGVAFLGDQIQAGINALRLMERGFRNLQVTALRAIREMDDGMFSMFRRFAQGWEGVVEAFGIFGGAVSGGLVGEAFRKMFSAEDAAQFRNNIDGTIRIAESRIRDLTRLIESDAEGPKFSEWLEGVFQEADEQRAARANSDLAPMVLPPLENLHDQIEELEEEHQEKLNDIVEMGIEDRIQMYTSAGQMIASNLISIYRNMGMATEKEEEKLFNIQKNARTAQAIVDGIGATISAYRFGQSISGGNPAVGAAFAATAAAAMGAQVAAIRSQSFNGSGTVTGPPSGGGASTPSAPQGQLFINLQGGDMFSGSQVRDLMDRIAEAQNDGYMVVV